MTSDALDTDLIQTMIRRAIEQHCRTYALYLPISFSWEADATNAERDVKSFQDILKALGLPKAEELRLRSKHSSPGQIVAKKVHELVTRGFETAGRTLILIHYAGHGMQGIQGHLNFASSHGRAFRVDTALLGPVMNLTSSEPVDVVFIFDSCYSHLATRDATMGGRIVEVLAATNQQNPTTYGPGQYSSFTGKLANEILARKRRGDESIEFAELIEHLRLTSPLGKPIHSTVIGCNSVRLWFPGKEGFDSTRTETPPSLYAVFSLRISRSLRQEEIDDFVVWLRKIPRRFGLSLDAVYETESQTLIFRGAYSFFSKLVGTSCVKLIAETTHPYPLQRIGLSRLKENVPPAEVGGKSVV
ncbi:hypothetical protein P170DRAFT_219342 [Aspergillus steynii IBT 23096]|uniref:Peptidase C14 caspase domain-containing protein n=1 Tax=Aspergillus steynii IBT 23096 TaxID=1392250 RepID=A0A2I2G1F0_9EURO|nr:uncharacterized protein P170DRAFT_219342 [Aspergillus steynii IBT 23096]PLB46686.1 hypothetical protein P170DRAFT_219342 [Aspergillus steynii IBT 23096]